MKLHTWTELQAAEEEYSALAQDWRICEDGSPEQSRYHELEAAIDIFLFENGINLEIIESICNRFSLKH